MSDQSQGDRTEKPTPKKRRDAHKKGQVPRSQELTTAFLLLAAALVLEAGGRLLARDVTALFRLAAAKVQFLPTGVEGMSATISGLGWQMLGALAPTVLVMGGTALLVGGAQARGVLTTEPLKPQWSKLDPIKNAKRLWGVKAVAELAKSLLKLGIVSVAVYWSLRRAMDEMPALAQQGPEALLIVMHAYAVRILWSAGLAYMVLALGDYAFQVWQHERQLRMSREEIKREHREMEGDQIIKVRRRTMGRQLARRRMLLAVSEADVVVTNPTHIAVALKYDPEQAAAPIVLAMGVRKVAARIRKIARESGVPTIENKPLARALWASAKVGLPIPVELYVAVAEVLAFVIRQRERRGAPWRGSSLA